MSERKNQSRIDIWAPLVHKCNQLKKEKPTDSYPKTTYLVTVATFEYLKIQAFHKTEPSIQTFESNLGPLSWFALNKEAFVHIIAKPWGISSAGRAPRSQRGGQRFDPAMLHQTHKTNTNNI